MSTGKLADVLDSLREGPVAAAGPIDLECARSLGDDFAAAVSYTDIRGIRRVGMVGASKDSGDGSWRTTGAWSSNETPARDGIFAHSGGWRSGDSAAFGGWLNDPRVRSARLSWPDRTPADEEGDASEVTEGIVIFFPSGPPKDACIETFAADGTPLTTAPVRPACPPEDRTP